MQGGNYGDHQYDSPYIPQIYVPSGGGPHGGYNGGPASPQVVGRPPAMRLKPAAFAAALLAFGATYAGVTSADGFFRRLRVDSLMERRRHAVSQRRV